MRRYNKYIMNYDFLKPSERELNLAKEEFMYFEKHKSYGYHIQSIIDSLKIYGEIFALMEIRVVGKNYLVVGDLSYNPKVYHIELEDLEKQEWIYYLPDRVIKQFNEILEEHI